MITYFWTSQRKHQVVVRKAIDNVLMYIFGEPEGWSISNRTMFPYETLPFLFYSFFVKRLCTFCIHVTHGYLPY